MKNKLVWVLALASTASVALFYAGNSHNHSHDLENPSRPLAARTQADEKQAKEVSASESTPALKRESVSTLNIAGTDVEIKFKELKFQHLSLKPDQTAADIYPILAQRALAGDAVGARILATELDHCNSVFVEESELDLALERLYTTKKYSSPDRQVIDASIKDEVLEGFANSLKENFEYCQGLSPDVRNEAEKWAKIGAENGDLLAMRMLIDKSEADPQTQLKWYKRSWSDYGDASAPNGIGHLYRKGLVPNQNGELVSDPKKAYTYFLVGLELEFALLRSFSPAEFDHNSANIRSDYSQFLSMLTSALTPQEQLEAEQEAVKLISDNPNCCHVEAGAGIEINSDTPDQ